MGLISLPLLNRVGSYQYWNSMWDSNYIYRRYFFCDIFIRKFLLCFFNNIIFNIFFKDLKEKKFKSGFLFAKRRYKKFNCLNYLGKISIYIYHGWVIFNIFIFVFSKSNSFYFRKNNLFYFYFSNFISNKNNKKKIFKLDFKNFSKSLNYKYKF
jgi:hypothetical protein